MTNIELCDIGMIGLGVMGRNLLLNMADHGFKVAGYDKDKSKVDSLLTDAKEQGKVFGATTILDFMKLLKKPHKLIMLVPAGAPVDSAINEFIPYLEKGDLIIDAGNSHFKDTDIRTQRLSEQGFHFMGVGISGGEEGARHGPSIMPGGSLAAYDTVRSIFEAVAAKVNGAPCVAYLGRASCGHYVKMVHNGIEYGIMQLIAETYDFMKRALGFNNQQLHDIYKKWNEEKLNSYLIEITSLIFDKRDEDKNQFLIDEIVPIAKQNGTGMWTSQSAMELQIPVPTIDLAVAMRDLSVLAKQREAASMLYSRPIKIIDSTEHADFLNHLQDALFNAMLVVYAQGMALLASASQKYAYQLDLSTIANIWRGGCIIRAELLNEIAAAFHLMRELPNCLLNPNLSKKVMATQESLRKIVAKAAEVGIPTPALMVTLSYLDAYRSAWLPANLIQAQRDYFGAHTYERIDAKGTFHTKW